MEYVNVQRSNNDLSSIGNRHVCALRCDQLHAMSTNHLENTLFAFLPLCLRNSLLMLLVG